MIMAIQHMFHSFLLVLLQGQSTNISFCFLLILPYVCWDGQVHYSTGPLFLLTITRSGRLAEIRGSVCISKSLRILYVSFSSVDSGFFIYYLFIWSNLNFLNNSLWITFLNQSIVVVHSFSANLRHSLIM